MSLPPHQEHVSRESLLRAFEGFRDELDDHNDRRERLIKSSRDVTNLSKKVIFLLHRTMTGDSQESDDRVLADRAAKRAQEKFREIRNIFAGMREDLAGERFWRHQRNVSPGLQEYIEALSFAYYLQHKALIPYVDVQNTLRAAGDTELFTLPVEDYLLGLSDLTGELMRYAISAISRRGGRSKANEVCAFVRGCKADFERFVPSFREMRRKQAVTSQSLQKIEDVVYAISVRSAEYDLPPEMLDDIVSRAVAGPGVGGQESRKRGRGGRGLDEDADEEGDDD